MKKMENLRKAFEIAKQLLQQHVDEKQYVSQDPDNPISVQNIQADEAM